MNSLTTILQSSAFTITPWGHTPKELWEKLPQYYVSEVYIIWLWSEKISLSVYLKQIDFNGISTLLGLFYAKRLGNCICCTNFHIFCVVSRVFTNGSGDWGSIPDRVIPKTFKKWYLIPPYLTLSIIRYVSRVKWSNPEKGVAPSPTPRFS